MTDHGHDTQVLLMDAPVGGVMTREVGAITGEVEVWIDRDDPEVARIRYAGALDTYTVVGPVAGRDLDEVVAVLGADVGADEVGNPLATRLT